MVGWFGLCGRRSGVVRGDEEGSGGNLGWECVSEVQWGGGF